MPDVTANVSANERETNIEATGADGAETGTGSPARKVRAPKKKKKTPLI